MAHETRRRRGQRQGSAADVTSSPETSGRSARNLPVVVGAIGLLAWIVWVCLQMAPYAQGGKTLLLGIFGGIALGGAAAYGGFRR